MEHKLIYIQVTSIRANPVLLLFYLFIFSIRIIKNVGTTKNIVKKISY